MNWDLFFEIYENIPRQGPGSIESTKKAFQKIKNLPENPHILDMGCGSGAQTLTLAKLTGGNIIALDNHRPFLETIKKKAASETTKATIETRHQSMLEMDFPPGSFDLIWAEGSIYFMGFENGLKTIKPLLKPRSYVSVSEANWFKPNPPAEIAKIWEEEYPDIKTIDQTKSVINDCGYKLLDHFKLPESDWWNFYKPMERRINTLKNKYIDDEKILAELSVIYKEIEDYRRFSDWYGYTFYIMEKRD